MATKADKQRQARLSGQAFKELGIFSARNTGADFKAEPGKKLSTTGQKPTISFQDRHAGAADKGRDIYSTFINSTDNVITTPVKNLHALHGDPEFFSANVQGNIKVYAPLSAASIMVGGIRAARDHWRWKAEQERSNVWRAFNKVNAQYRQIPGAGEAKLHEALTEENKQELYDAIAPYIGDDYEAYICDDGQLLVGKKKIAELVLEDEPASDGEDVALLPRTKAPKAKKEDDSPKKHYADRVDAWWKAHPKLGSIISHFWKIAQDYSVGLWLFSYVGMVIVGTAAFNLGAALTFGLPLIPVGIYALVKIGIKAYDAWQTRKQDKTPASDANVEEPATEEEIAEMKANARRVIRAYTVDKRFEALQAEIRHHADKLGMDAGAINQAEKEAEAAMAQAKGRWETAKEAAKANISARAPRIEPELAVSFWSNLWDGIKSIFNFGAKARAEEANQRAHDARVVELRGAYNSAIDGALAGTRIGRTAKAEDLAYTKVSAWQEYMTNHRKRVIGIGAAMGGFIGGCFMFAPIQEALALAFPVLVAGGPVTIAAALVVITISLIIARYSYKYAASQASKEREELQGKLENLQEKLHEAEYWEHLIANQRDENNGLRQKISTALDTKNFPDRTRARYEFETHSMPRADNDRFYRAYDAEPRGWKEIVKKGINRFIEFVWGAEMGSLTIRLLFGAAATMFFIGVPVLAAVCLTSALAYGIARTYFLYHKKSEKEHVDDRCADLDVRITGLQHEYERLVEEHAVLTVSHRELTEGPAVSSALADRQSSMSLAPALEVADDPEDAAAVAAAHRAKGNGMEHARTAAGFIGDVASVIGQVARLL